MTTNIFGPFVDPYNDDSPISVVLQLVRGDDIDFYMRFGYDTVEFDDTTFVAYDLTNYTFECQVRRTADDVDHVDFTCTTVSPQIGDDRGLVHFEMAHAVSATLPNADCVLDVQAIDPSGNISTWVKGVAPVYADVSR